MLHYLHQNDLCYSIFSCKLDDHLQFSNLRPKLQSLIPKGKFPILNFKKYQNDYKSGADFLVLLKKYKFSFPFDKDFLNELARKENHSVNETLTSPDYIVLIVLHFYITWYVNFIQNVSLSDTLTLLQNLLLIMNIKNCKFIDNNRLYAASAFINAYSKITESNILTNIVDILPPIVEFLTLNNDIPQNSFDLLLKLSYKVFDPSSTKFTKEMSHFVNFILIIVRTCGSRCPDYITTGIVTLMSKYLIELDKDALLFFGHSIQTLENDLTFSIISKFPDSIKNKIIENENPIFNCNSLKNDQGLVFPASEVVFENKLLTYSTFDRDIRDLIKTPPYFPELLSPQELISPNILEIFEILYKIVENEDKFKEILITNIISILSSCTLSPHYYDINAAFLYFLYVLSKNCKIKSIPDEIFMSHLFRQNVTIFNHDDNFNKINTIRQLAFLLLLNQTPEVIHKNLLSIRLKPYTFAEFVYRLLPDQSISEKLLEISVLVFEGVMNAIVFYQKFQNISDELKTASCEARIAAFTYIDITLKIPDFRKKFFESSYCVDAIISLAFENNVRKWVLFQIIDAFYLENTSFTYLIQSCLNLFQISCNFGFTKDEIQQVESLIQFLDHDIFNSKNQLEILNSFEPVISNICKWVAGLIKYAFNELESSSELNPDPQYLMNPKDYYIHSLDELMNILTRFSAVHTLSQSDISLINATAKYLYNNEPSDDFFERLICTIAGEFLQSTEPSFDIKQPKAMKLIITLFENSENFLSKINYIISLCNYSTDNCVQLQNGEFDLFLVGYLFNLRNNKDIKKEIFTQCLLILRLIAAYSSSISFVHQYISLFCPIDCKILPRFHQEILDSMQNILQNSLKFPATSLPIFSTTKVTARNVKIIKSFTVSFWFFIYNNEEEITITEIINENQKLSIQFLNNKISISFQIKQEKWKGVFSFDLPFNQWSFASFSMQYDNLNDRMVIKASINGIVLSPQFFPYFDFSENMSKVNVGISDNDKLSVMLGSFAITSYFDPSYSTSLYDSGPRRVPKNPIFFFKPHNKNDNYEIETIPSTLKATIQKVRTLHKPSFSDLLIDICGVSILIPIIANIDLSYKNGINLPFLLEQFIEILEISLSLSLNSQRLFASDKGFFIISNILLSSEFIELNYKVFYRFCSLFDLLENEKCRSHLLFGILLKFDLWIRCDATNLKRILHHCSNTLVPLNLPLIMKKINFNDIIVALRIFFWYEPLEKEIILHENKRCIHHVDDIRTCRHHLLTIAFMMLMKNLTNKEIKFVISQILSIEDKEQVLDLLHFIDELIDNREMFTQNPDVVMDSLAYLMFLYSTDSNVIELSLNIIIKAYNLSIIKEMTLTDQIDLMIHELPGSYAYPSILANLLKICSTKEPKLFPLCSMIAFSFGLRAFINLLDVLKPNILYCSTSSWSLWPIIALFKFNEPEFQTRLISFLIEISPHQWQNIFWTIDNVGRFLNIDQDSMKKKFIIELSNYLLKLDKPNEDCLHQYFLLVPQFLFLLSYYQGNLYLESLINENFTTKCDVIEENKQITRNNNNNEYKNIEFSESSESSDINDIHAGQGQRRINKNTRNNKSKQPQIAFRRRSSFRSFDSSSFTSSKEKFMNLDFIKFKITHLISMIKYTVEKVKYKVYFGMRINEKNIWEDINVVKMANQIFKKFPRLINYDSCLFINAFMLHYDINDALETVNSLKANNEQLFSFECSLYNKHANIINCQTITNEQPSSYNQKSYKILQQFENKYHENNSLINIYTIIVNNQEKAKKLYNNYIADISQISTESIADFKENLSLKNTKYSKYWAHFWRAMSIKRAPWEQSLSEEQKKKNIYFKRDFILCASMCPFKMRPNNKFDNHKEASQKRDEDLSNQISLNAIHSKSGNLLNIMNSQSSLSNTKSALFGLNNSILLESSSDFTAEQLRVFNTNSTDEITINKEFENSKCIFESTCEIFTVNHKYKGMLSLQKECIVINKSVDVARVIKNEDIVAVMLRTVLHRNTAIEIFLNNGMSFFINFPEIKWSEIIKQFKIIKKSLENPFFLQIQPPKQLASFSKCTILWQNKKISNFDYLMILNMISGRSFNNPSQYPFLPWIIKDYNCETLDLNNPEIYRDLSKPVGTLGKAKLEQLKMTHDELPYLYSNGNISPLIVFLWLVRIEPFTTLQIEDQNGSFESPDRQFKSLEDSFNSVLTLSSDFRELIPEFFFQPEFLVNKNNFDFGISCGKRVDNVELPKWIKTDSKEPIVAAYEFIYMHRKALESDHVSAHLNEWIDLTWGDKARGEKAIESNNIYLPEMYPEIWDNLTEKELEENTPTIETILGYVGQIPQQLFDKPHPQRCCSVDQNILDKVIHFQTRNEKCKINIGAITFPVDKKTISILIVDENGVCIENDYEIEALQNQSTNDSNEENEISRTSSDHNKHLSSPSIHPVTKVHHHKSLSKKFLSLLDLNDSSKNRKSLLSDIENGNSHFDPTNWKPAFHSSQNQVQTSFFTPLNGFKIRSSKHDSSNFINDSNSANLWKKFFIVDNLQKSDLYLADPKNCTFVRVVRQHNDITAISTDGYKWLAVANKDSKIYVYSLDEINKINNTKQESNTDDIDDDLNDQNYLLKVEFSIPSSSDFVKCCDISTNFHNLVCGTRDKSLMICSMTTHSIVKIVELDAKPIQLLITPSWGFIAVYMKSISIGNLSHSFAVYGTNGYLLRKVEIENGVKKMISWKDEKGFDFISYVDSQNKIFVFEAFYCEIGDPVYELSSNAIDIEYMESYHAIVALCDDGMNYVIPVLFD